MNRVSIKVKNGEHYNAIMDRLKVLECSWEYGDIKYSEFQENDCDHININAKKEITMSHGRVWEICTLDDLYDIEERIMINGEVVEFKKDGIKVGCTTVSKETIKKIWDKVKESDYAMAE